MKCLLCQNTCKKALSLKEIFLFEKLWLVPLCALCKGKFERLNRKVCCTGCSRPFGEKLEQTLCKECQEWETRFPTYHFKHQALYQYNEAMQVWLKQYKYEGDYQLAKCFAPEIAQLCQSYRSKWLIVPVPTNEETLEKRGFNQTSALLRTAKIPYQDIFEKENKLGQKQAKLDKKARMKFKEDTKIKQTKLSLVKGARILIFDDVYTTGTTLKELMLLCFVAGAKEVQSISLIRA